MSQNNLFDVDQADMLLHYSNEKKNRSTCITSPVNTKMIEDLLVTFRSAIIDKNQKKAISILSTIRSSESYTLQTINESYCTDEFKISLHLWTKAGKRSRQYGSCGDISMKSSMKNRIKNSILPGTHIHIYFTETYFQKFKNYFNLLHDQLYQVCGHVRVFCFTN